MHHNNCISISCARYNSYFVCCFSCGLGRWSCFPWFRSCVVRTRKQQKPAFSPLRGKSLGYALLDRDTKVSYAATWMHAHIYSTYLSSTRVPKRALPQRAAFQYSRPRGGRVVGSSFSPPPPCGGVWAHVRRSCPSELSRNYVCQYGTPDQTLTRVIWQHHNSNSGWRRTRDHTSPYIALHLRVCAYKNGVAFLAALVRRIAFLHHPLILQKYAGVSQMSYSKGPIRFDKHPWPSRLWMLPGWETVSPRPFVFPWNPARQSHLGHTCR